jgi:hypothetical protein
MATPKPDAAVEAAPAVAPTTAATPSDRTSTQAIVTYVLLGQFNAVGVGIFALIAFGVKIDPVMLGVLGGLIAAVTNAVSLAIGFWLGSSSGSKTQSATIAQLAGANSGS